MCTDALDLIFSGSDAGSSQMAGRRSETASLALSLDIRGVGPTHRRIFFL